MNAMQLCNEPVAFKVGGQVLHFRRLSAIRLAALKQAAYMATQYEALADAIDVMPDVDKADARAAKTQAMRDETPIGYAFIEASNRHALEKGMRGMNGLIAEACADGLDADAIGRALLGSTHGEQCAIIEHIFNSRRALCWTDSDIRYILKFMAEKYGYMPEQVAALSDDQLFDLVPGLAEAEAKKLGDKAKAEAKKATETPANG